MKGGETMYAKYEGNSHFLIESIDENIKNKTITGEVEFKVKEFIYCNDQRNTFHTEEVILLDKKGNEYKSIAHYWGYNLEKQL